MPLHAKTARTYYTDAMIASAKAKAAKFDWAKAQRDGIVAGADWLAKMSDKELWDFVPPPEQMRAINVHIGHDCPICGPEITRKAGHYPWLLDRNRPFKVKCPVCNTEFPSNDFTDWNRGGPEGTPETGPGYVDKGIGWLGPEGRRYHFVAYYIFWQRWVRDILGGIRSLSQAYLLTDNPLYAHKCAVLLAKVASEYDRFDYAKQSYHEGIKGIHGRISDYIWSTGDDSKITLAYDAVYPAFDQDQALLSFLKEKGIEDARQVIETKMLHKMAKDVMTGFVAGNMGMHQTTMCYLAIVLNNDDPSKGPTTKEMRDWLMSGGGRVEDLLWNGFHREGIGAESSPGYSSGWCVYFYEIADLLPRIGVDIWKNPKLKKMADIGLDLTVAGKFSPDLGDSGGLQGSGPVAWAAELQGRGFAHYKDPRFAKALALMGAKPHTLWEDYFDEEEVARVVAKEGKELGLKTRNLGGYGLAVLESGKEPNRRAVSLYYGDASGGHGHHDRLSIEVWANGRPVMPDDGYPFPFTRHDFFNWRGANTIRHYCVLVDQATQTNLAAGHLNTLASTPELQLVDASAESAYPRAVSLYRRTTALIDSSPDSSYLLDIFRVRGGRQHDWCFHGPPFPEFSVAGGEPGPVQTKGTLAGEGVPYGTRPPSTYTANGVPLDLLNADGLLPGDYAEPSKQGWAIFGKCVLTRKAGAAIRVKTPALPAGKTRLFMRIYDYNKGSNVVAFQLGNATVPLRCEPCGAAGYRWISEIVDLPAGINEVTLTAEEVAQEFVQVDNVIFSRDLQQTEPVVLDSSNSGFQGLFNVQRMKPQREWSATWRKPDEDLSVTMTMPAGCTQEVVIADGEPETQPGNPNTIKYVLGRNVLPDEKSSNGVSLLSKYVAVVEPHKGTAAITAVKQQQAKGVGTEAVGVEVERGRMRDLVHSSLNSAERCEWKGVPQRFIATGEFAMVTVDDQGVQRACLVNGTVLRCGDFYLRAAPSPQGKVLSVDHEHNTISLDVALPSPGVWRDAVVLLGNDLHQTSYTIKEAKVSGNRTTIGFGDVLFLVGMGHVGKVDSTAKTVESATALTGYGKIEGGRHAGRWLYNEDKSKGFRIATIEGNTFKLDGVTGDLASIFKDTDGDGRVCYWISDVGPGDTFRIPATTFVRRLRPGQYEVQAMTEVKLTAPRGS
ncbi:MAG: heparinase II/III family protein [Armatimonadetes bacterium]|nr:heparinase II/III family protein [Armatimonadota bacterium]